MFDEIYIRDKRSPIPKNKNVSKVMSSNKGKNSKPEIFLRKELWKNGLKGYRIHYTKIPGSPDIVFVSKKIALFVNGCFWHRCPYCKYDLPKNNVLFWKNKFEKNVNRDKKKIIQLKKLKWKVFTVWECQLNSKPEICIRKIKRINELQSEKIKKYK